MARPNPSNVHPASVAEPSEPSEHIRSTGAVDQPLSQELLQWLHEQSAAGVTPETITNAMVHAGWRTEAAHRALRHLAGDPADPGLVATPSRPTAADTRAARAQPGPDRLSRLPFLDAAGHQVDVLIEMQHPPLAVFSQLLTRAECDALIAAARPRLARSLTVETQTGGEEINADRTSEGMFFERGESALIQQIEERIAALLHWPVEFGEGLQVLRYGPGAQYKPHYDYFDPAEPGTPALLRRGGQRLGTLILYLNTPQAGGATVFPQIGLDVAAQQGHAVFFGYPEAHPDTRSLHGGAPVLEGEKWIATKWLRSQKFQ